jgi:hypothetical protein
MGGVVTIGQVPWSREDMLAKLQPFEVLYRRRPIRDNTGGMLAPHMFLAWFVLQHLQPKAIVESGVWLGQGTWFFEQACPKARLYCIDPNLTRIQYRSPNATYFDRDFATIDWRALPRDETVLFFDDHQDAYERLKTVSWFGFRQAIFEDNYPAGQGDLYSLKKVFTHAGGSAEAVADAKGHPKTWIGSRHGSAVRPAESTPVAEADEPYLRENTDIYQELPPVFRVPRTRWGDEWNDASYPTPEPLLTAVEAPYQQVFLDEAQAYTWMCYVRVKAIHKG